MIGRMIRERREDGRKSKQIKMLIAYAQTLLNRCHHRPHQQMTDSTAALLDERYAMHHGTRSLLEPETYTDIHCTPYLEFSGDFLG